MHYKREALNYTGRITKTSFVLMCECDQNESHIIGVNKTAKGSRKKERPQTLLLRLNFNEYKKEYKFLI